MAGDVSAVERISLGAAGNQPVGRVSMREATSRGTAQTVDPETTRPPMSSTLTRFG
jgi:hypothetical protein